MFKSFNRAFIVCSAVLCLSTSNASAHSKKNFQGFSLGGNVGYGVGWGKFKLLTPPIASFKEKSGFYGVDGGVGIGYTHVICNWAIGLAFDANWSNTKGSHTYIVPSETVRGKTMLDNSLQLYAKLGHIIGCVMPFIGLGWDNSQWKVKEAGVVSIGAITVAASATAKKRLNGFLWKAGVDFLTFKNLVIGLEYTGRYGGKVQIKNNPQLPGGLCSCKPQYNKVAVTARIVL